MTWWTDIPVRRKLTLVILLTCTTVLLLACAALAAYEFITFRRTMARDMTVLADVLSRNITSALAFQDESEASKTLLALNAEPQIIAACLYAKDGSRFAAYVRPSATVEFPPQPGPDTTCFQPDELVLFRPVMLNEKRIGTLYLRADLAALYDRLRLFGGIVGLVLLGSFIVTVALSSRLQRPISEPILALARTAKSIAERKDYSVRAEKQSRDETGLLTDAFNQMLSQIQERETALRRGRDELELRVEERTAELARANVGLQVEIAERERTQRRVATQYAVTRILAESIRLAETTPKIVRAICEQLGWGHGRDLGGRAARPGAAMRWNMALACRCSGRVRNHHPPADVFFGRRTSRAGLGERSTSLERGRAAGRELSSRTRGSPGGVARGLCPSDCLPG